MYQQDLIATIEKTAPLSAAAEWDHSGLQVASHRTTVQKVAVCLDPLPASIDQALALEADFILVHHPLALKPVLPARLDAFHEVLSKLLRADVALYAAHTSLDANPHGPAGWLAQELQMQQTSVLEQTAQPEGFASPFGFGLVGNLVPALTLPQILKLLAQFITLETAVLAGTPPPEQISRLAYCTGSGSSLLSDAQKASAQIFITGDIKYHTALSGEICMLDVGHHSLEEEMMRRFSIILQNALEDLTIVFIPSHSPFRSVVRAFQEEI